MGLAVLIIGLAVFIGCQPSLIDGVLCRLAIQVLCERVDGALVGDTRCHVRPLPWVVALREQAAELVEAGGRRAEYAVCVVVDVADTAQYFAK